MLRSQFAHIPRELSLTFALFNEIAGRDTKLMARIFDEFFYLVGAETFYSDINAIPTAMK